MGDIWIKICGIRRAEDARAAVELGANAIGVVCYPPSKRYLPPARITEVLDGIAGEAETYALFVNPDPAEVRAVTESGLCSGLQFHGDESAEFCESFGLPYMKALRVRDDGNTPPELSSQAASFASAERILLDAWSESSPGGTGKTFRWQIAAALINGGIDNIVVAGGLNADNVAEAIRATRPFGVDVSSGVEASTGVKDPNKLRNFIQEARSA